MEGLIAQGLQKRFRSRVVVNRVTLDIQPGEFVAAVEDPSGEPRVLVEPAADREHGQPGAGPFRLGEQRLRLRRFPLPVEGEGHPGTIARTVLDLRAGPKARDARSGG